MVRFRIDNNFSSLLPYFSPRKHISHLLILIAVIVSLLGFAFPILIQLFGLHQVGLKAATIPFLLGQLALYQFLHGNLLHLFLNAYFLYSAGPEVESRMSRREFLEFFLGGTLFVAASLWVLAPYSLTIGISGFCMVLLSYLYMDLQHIRHPMAQQVLIMLIINILLGLTGNISFVGHAS
jgi:membrane associated rhomboid family serine protease